MAKRGERKKEDKAAAGSGVAHAPRLNHQPRKRPVLLAISAVLFAAWFAFLLMTALGILFAPALQMR